MGKIKLQPIEYRVIVLPDSVEEVHGSGLIVKAETTKTQDRRTQTKGKIVAVSDCSFDDWNGSKPLVGDRVEFAMYAGQFYTEDDVEYRIMNDTDIIGIIKE